MLIKLVDHHLRYGIALELDDDAHSVAVRFVAQIADPLDFLLLDQPGDLLDQADLVNHIGNLADDDLLFSGPLDRFRKGLSPHLDNSPALRIGLRYGLLAMDKAGCGEVRPRNIFHQLFDGDIRFLHHCYDTVHDFSQVVRGNIGGHADGDA